MTTLTKELQHILSTGVPIVMSYKGTQVQLWINDVRELEITIVAGTHSLRTIIKKWKWDENQHTFLIGRHTLEWLLENIIDAFSTKLHDVLN